MSSIGTTCAIAAARRAALHAEIRPERRLADADRRLLADGVQPVAEADGRRRLALAGRGRVDRRDEHQMPVRAVRQRLDELLRDLRLVMAERQQVLGRDAELGADLLDGLLVGFAGDFDVGHCVFLPVETSVSGAEGCFGFEADRSRPVRRAHFRAAFGADPFDADASADALHRHAGLRHLHDAAGDAVARHALCNRRRRGSRRRTRSRRQARGWCRGSGRRPVRPAGASRYAHAFSCSAARRWPSTRPVPCAAGYRRGRGRRPRAPNSTAAG